MMSKDGKKVQDGNNVLSLDRNKVYEVVTKQTVTVKRTVAAKTKREAKETVINLIHTPKITNPLSHKLMRINILDDTLDVMSVTVNDETDFDKQLKNIKTKETKKKKEKKG